MFFKRIILSSILVVCLGQTTLAIPAYPRSQKVMQADGTYITITLYGDEHGHIALADDGQPLCFNGATGNYDYATLRNGVVVSSGMKAENAAQRGGKVVEFLKTLNCSQIMTTVEAQRKLTLAKIMKDRMALQRSKVGTRAAVNNTDMRINDNFPTKGVQHSLVILAQFSDCPFTTVGNDVQQFYEDMLNKEGFSYTNGANGSARDFYVASSFGKFLPTFDVIGPITLPKSYSYYGENGAYRDNASRLMEFVKDACTQADPLVDFSKYDHDGDGVVDNVFIYFAGYGEADSGKGNTIWPHAADYRSVCKDAGANSSELVLDGKQIASYTCSNEINGQTVKAQPTGIGTFVHEFGHVLGLADHYDSQASSLAEAFHPGPYDTMASGSYNNNGNTPPVFSAFERASLGWLEYEDLTSAADTLNVLPNLASSNKAYRIPVNGTLGKEFFVLENRQQVGWDQYLPGHGMLMWHIDYDANAWNGNYVNTNNAHQRIDIVEADKIQTSATRAGDTFPGGSNVTSWKMTSWNGETVMTLDDIEEKNGNVNVMLGGLNVKLPTPIVTINEVNDSNAVASWQTANIAKRYVLNLYKVENGKKTVVPAYADKVLSSDLGKVEFVNLQSQSDYQITLQAQRGSYASDIASANFRTTAIPFAKLYPTNVKVSDKTLNSFKASWEEVEGADDYEVTLNRYVYSDAVTQQGYGFTDQLAGMPSAWETNGSFINTTYGEAAPSLRLNKDGAYLNVSYGTDAYMSGIKFWAKCSNTASGRILVQIPSGLDWETKAAIEVDEDLKNGKVYNFQFDKAESLRISVDRSAGIFYLDDVYADCHLLQAVPLDNYDEVSTQGKKAMSFEGLQGEGSLFLLSVCAKKGNEKSVATQVRIDLSATTGIDKTSNSSDNSTIYYDLNGRRLSGKPVHGGVYIVKQGNKTYKRVY